VSNHTPYALLGGVLFMRGLGLGASIQPATAAAYAVLDSSQVPRATAALNTVRQIGGSIGTALLAVVLQHEAVKALSSTSGGLLAPLPAAERAQISAPVATAFGHTFMWAAVLALLTIVPAIALLRAEHASRAPTRPRPPRSSPSTISPAAVGEVPTTSVPQPARDGELPAPDSA
jgi:hypothetical protein